MQRLVSLALICALPGLAMAQTQPEAAAEAEMILAADTVPEDSTETAAEDTPGLRILQASEVDLDALLWAHRIVAVLADTPNDPAFIQQLRDLEARADDMIERDVVVIVDSDRNSGSELRRRLRPRGFMLAIIEKDGNVAQRRPAPRDVREINAIIDRFPLRRQEMLERRPAGR